MSLTAPAERMLRIGVLGAARITRTALLAPAADLAGVRVTAIAAREPARAREYAAKHGIPEVHSSYASLIADPAIDAVYIALPAALHGRWTRAAIEAGKHVLCEKPFAANAEEAAAVADFAGGTTDATGAPLVVAEAFHYRYHPLMRRLVEIARSGELGAITRVEASFRAVLPPGGDIRWNASLGGGTTMDVGCYPVHLVRSVLGEEPHVVSARARSNADGIDRTLTAELAFPSGATGRIDSALWSARGPAASARVIGTKGSVTVLNPWVSMLPQRFVVRSPADTRRERFSSRSTYSYQLEAFRDAVLDGIPILTPPADAVANMTVIDACYRAAGMSPRAPLD